jgi:hypothetical protein
VKTEDLDVDREMSTKREHAIPGEIKRDTAANIAGGKQVNHIKSIFANLFEY